MKTIKLSCVAVGLAIWTGVYAQQTMPTRVEDAISAYAESENPLVPDGKIPGRFTLVSAEYDSGQGKSVGLFRLDTMTGQVWEMTSTKFKTDQPQGMWITAWAVIREAQAMQMGLYLMQQAEKDKAEKGKR